MAATHQMQIGIIFFSVAMLTVLSDTGCTSIINDDTCIINRTSEWDLQVGNIVCNASLPKCIVLCQDVLSCSDNLLGNRLSIICPSNGERCIINCTSSRSCRTTQIYSSNSKYTEINIKANNAGRDMHIYTSHELHINVIGSDADFLESIVYSLALSTIIDINCDNGEMCTDNTINARKTAESLTLSCNGLRSDCSNSNIWCPATESMCNIDCAICHDMNVYTSNAASNIEWYCENKNSCTDSKLICDEKQDHLLWNDDNQRWEFDENVCNQVNQAYIYTVNTTKRENTKDEITTNESPKIMLNTMLDEVYVYNTSFMVGVDELDTTRMFTLASNRLHVTAIAASCTIGIVCIFWCCFSFVRERYGKREGRMSYDHDSCSDSEMNRRVTVGAPPPRKTGRNGETGIIRVLSNMSDSVDLEYQASRYNHVRRENVLNTEFMDMDVDVDDIDDSILCVQPEGVRSHQIIEGDDVKCTEADSSDIHPTPGVDLVVEINYVNEL